MHIRNMKTSHVILLILFGIYLINGPVFSKMVHNHYISPENKRSSDIYSRVKNIKWASIENNKVLVCIYGKIKKVDAPGTGYTAISTYKTIRSMVPELINSDETYLASFDKELISAEKRLNWAQMIHIKPSTITPDCDAKPATNKISVFNQNGFVHVWFEANKQDHDFIYNRIHSSPDHPHPWISYYVLVLDQDNKKITYPFYFEIGTSVEHNSKYDVIIGILLYPFAFILDVLTSPLLFIATHLRWG